MSILKVANVHLETTGTNRIDYDSNGFTRIISGGTGGIVINTGGTDKVNVGANISVTGNLILNNKNVDLLISATSPSFDKANAANIVAVSSFNKANTGLANTTGTVFNGILYITANLGIGLTTTPTANLHVVGDIVATSDITSAYSDERLKEIIEPITNAISKVESLDTFYYRPNRIALELGLKDDIQIGVSAQQVQNILPQIVKSAPIDSKYLTVQYERLVPLLIEAIKELTQRIEKLENGTKNRKCNWINTITNWIWCCWRFR
jgi:hypothetical protein